MKKLVIIIPILLVALIIFFCYYKIDTIVHLGINTEIVEINNDDKTIDVHYKDEQKNIDLNFKVDCSIAMEKHQIFYCDYSTHMIQELSFDSLFVGDEIILSISNTDFLRLHNDDIVQAIQIQLATQRLNVE